MIPYGKQDINQSDIDGVVEVLRSDYLTQGPCVPKFEGFLARYVGSRYAVAVNSATSALHLACLSLGLSKGDIFWTSPISFVASSNVALLCGARVDFVDIDVHTNNMSVASLRKKLIKAKEDDALPKIVMPVHMGGFSCEMAEIWKLSREFNFRVIEDASHAIGAKYYERPVGSCEFSDITVFSFHPVKIVTTGEGGAATTNNETLYQKMQILRTHGIVKDPELMKKKDEGDWYYEQIDLGMNYRMTDLQAALGCSQMLRVDSFVEQRNAHASAYHELLAGLPVELPPETSHIYSSYHLYIINLKSKDARIRRLVFDFMRARGIGVHVHYIPIHLQPYYQKLNFSAGDFSNAEQYYQSALSLPIFPGLDDDDRQQVVSVLQDAIDKYSGM